MKSGSGLNKILFLTAVLTLSAASTYCAMAGQNQGAVSTYFKIAKTAEQNGKYLKAVESYEKILSSSKDYKVRSFLKKKIHTLKKLSSKPVQPEKEITITGKREKLKPQALQSKEIRSTGTAEYFAMAKSAEKNKDFNRAVEIYGRILDNTNNPSIKSFLKSKINQLKKQAKAYKGEILTGQAIEPEKTAPKEPKTKTAADTIDMAKYRSKSFSYTPAVSPETEAVFDEKTEKSAYLLTQGDTLYKNGNYLEALKMYIIAFEMLK